MAKRIKTDRQLQPISDWQQADQLVKQIGELQLQIQQEEKAANDIITDAKAQLAEDTKSLFEKITILTDSLEAFAANHTEDFGKLQSRKLNFGTVGWRKSTIISIKQTTLELIKKVFRQKGRNIYSDKRRNRQRRNEGSHG